MPEQTRIDFRGGMSRLKRQLENQCYYIQNARPDVDGTLKVRGGQNLWGTVGSGGSIVKMYSRYDIDNGLKIYSVKREDGVTDAIYDGTTALTGATFKASEYCSALEHKGKVFFSNGKGPILYHTPGESTIAETTGGILGKHMIKYKNKIFIGRDNGDIHFSNDGMYDTLPALDFHALSYVTIGSAGNGITSMLAGQEFIIAFLAGSYHVMAGVPGDDGSLGDMIWQSFYGTGCLHPNNATISGRTVYFLGSDRQLYTMEGYSINELDPAGRIQEYLDAVPASMLKYVTLNFVNNELWVYIPQGQDPTTGTHLVYLTNLKCWVAFTNINGYSMTKVGDLNRYFVGSAGSGAIWEQEASTLDLGSLISFQLIGRQEPLGSYRHKKKYAFGSVQADLHPGDSIAASYSLNGASTYTAFDSGTPLTFAGKLWGAENWGVSTWDGEDTQNGLLTKLGILRPASGTRLVGREIRIKITGSVQSGAKLLGYSIAGEIISRND
jgi:hypothetical protein